MRLSLGGDRLEPSKLDIAEIIQNEVTSINAVVGDGSPEKSDDEPPTTVLSSLNALQQNAFLRFWKKIAAYIIIYVRYILILKRIFGPQLMLML